MSSTIIYYISHYGYTAIFILVFLQEVGFPNPFPNEIVLMFSGYLTFTGALSLPMVLLVAITADLTGAIVLYSAFYSFGAFILNHKPKWLPISTDKINRLSIKISTGGLWSLFLGRLTPFIRGYVSAISGLLQIPPKRYVPMIIVTAVMVCSTYIIAGRLLGPYWSDVAPQISKVKYGILALLLVIILFILICKYKKGKSHSEVTKKAAKEHHQHPLKIHMISETAFINKGQGVDTAFVELVQLLREKNDVKVFINNEGVGDVIHSHTYGPYYFWKGLKYKNRRIHTVHVIPDSIKGSLPMWKYLLPLARIYFKLTFSYADMLIAISPMVEKAIKELGVKTPITKIYNPVLLEKWIRTPENRKRSREMLGVDETATIVLGVGQLQDRKGVEDFIDIGEAIPNAKFIWVGGRPFGVLTEGVNRINNRIEKASSNILFAGMFDLEDMPAIYAAADIFLFPSYQENCPLAPLEAAASGMPVIYRDLQEYSLLYKYPYLKAVNTVEFISLTKRLMNDPCFYKEATQISARLIEQFDKNIIRSELIGLYKQVIYNANHKINESITI